MKFMVLLRASCVFLLLWSCNLALSKKEMCENVLPPPLVKKSVDLALCESTFAKGNWPKKQWWKQYKSEELNKLVQEALEQNPTIQGIKQRVDWAKNEAIISRSTLYPFVFFNASDIWQYLSKNGVYRALNPTIPLNSHDVDLSIGFDYEFDFWNKYRNTYEAALGREKAAMAEAADVELIISTALAQAYFGFRANILRQNLYKKLYLLRKKYFCLQTEMLKNALYSKLTPLLSEEEVFEAKKWLLDSNQKVLVSKHVVNVLAGKGPDKHITYIDHLADLPKTLAVPTDISTELISRRPDLQAQIWRLDAFSKEVGVARADFLPNINLSGLMGLEGFSWSDVFEWASRTIGLFPGFEVPLYTAGRIGANVEAKRALFNEAVYEYNNLILKSFQQVADLLAIGNATYKERAKQQQIVQNATQRYELTKMRQNIGIDSALISYKVLEEKILKEIVDVELLYQQYAVSISLTKALGGGYVCPERRKS